MREVPLLERTFNLRRILRLWRRWVFLFVWLLAASLSASLQYLGNFNSDHYAFPILVGVWFCWRLWRRNKPFRLTKAFRPFPSWNFYLLVMGLMFIVYPFSFALQNTGILPLFVLAGLLDALFWATTKHGLDLGTVTAAIGLLI